MIFHNPIDIDDEVSMKEEEKIDVVVDAESVIRDLPITEALDAALSDEKESQERISFGGIWWNSSWAQNWDLYDDHDYWRCDDDTIIEDPEEEDPKEEDPEEEDPEEEDPEEEDPERRNQRITVRMKTPLALM